MIPKFSIFATSRCSRVTALSATPKPAAAVRRWTAAPQRDASMSARSRATCARTPRSVSEESGAPRPMSRGTAAPRELQLLEQQRLELLGGVDPEVVADGVVRLVLDARDLACELFPERAQIREVDRDAGLLHLHEHVDERELDVAVQALESEALELDRELLAKARGRDRAGTRAREPLVERRRSVRVLAVGHREHRDLELEPLRREVLEPVVPPARVHEVARDHRVHHEAVEARAAPPQRAPRGLRVVRRLRDRLVAQ